MYDPWQRNCPVKKSCKQNLCFQGTTELCGDEYEKSARWVICSLIVNKVFLILKWIQFIMTFWGYLSKSKTRIILYFKLQAGVAYNDVFQSAFYLLGISPLKYTCKPLRFYLKLLTKMHKSMGCKRCFIDINVNVKCYILAEADMLAPTKTLNIISENYHQKTQI